MNDLLSIAVSNAVAATVLALVVLAVGVDRRPALMHGLWLLVLLKLVTPPLFFLPVPWPTTHEPVLQEIEAAREEPTIASPLAVGEPETVVIVPVTGEVEFPSVENLGAPTPSSLPMPPQPSPWPRILSNVWGVGALVWFLLALQRLHRFRRLIRCARPASAALQERTRRLADSLGLKRCPRVLLLPGRIAPMLWAIGGLPRLLVPVDLLPLLNDEQLDTLLLHELAHLRRRDHWVRILEFAVMGLYWWHPVVWYARRELREAEEQCCDAWVVSTLPDAGRIYASALLDTLDFLSTTQVAVPPLASGLSQLADLKRRLTMIMRGNTPRSLTWPGCVAIITLGLTVLPMLPSLRGELPRKEEDTSKAEVKAAEAQLETAKVRLEEVKQRNVAHLMKQFNELYKEGKYAEAVTVALRLKELGAEAEYLKTLQQAKLQREKSNTPRLRIEIVVDAEGINVPTLIEKLKKVFPQKSAKISISESAGRYTKWLYPGIYSAPVVEPAEPAPVLRNPKDPDKRINDLEKKLEKVLRELNDLRRKLEPPPAAPLPAPGVVPPPAAGPAPRPPAFPPGTLPAPGSPPPPPATPFRLVPAPTPEPTKGESRPAPLPSSNNPYYAPTVPLKNAPSDPTRR